jgi:hypothetical protein
VRIENEILNSKKGPLSIKPLFPYFSDPKTPDFKMISVKRLERLATKVTDYFHVLPPNQAYKYFNGSSLFQQL